MDDVPPCKRSYGSDYDGYQIPIHLMDTSLMARTLVIASQSTKQTLKLEDTQTIGFVARIQKPPYGYLFGIALPPNVSH